MTRTDDLSLITKKQEIIEENISVEKKTLKIKFSQDDFRNYNDFIILKSLVEEGPLTRPDIVSSTKMPRTTVYDGLNRLIIQGIVRKYSHQVGGVGRPKVFFESLVKII